MITRLFSYFADDDDDDGHDDDHDDDDDENDGGVVDPNKRRRPGGIKVNEIVRCSCPSEDIFRRRRSKKKVEK